ncbi:MAG: hypothetical protein C4328_13270 [Meiothermus sp.]
MRWKLAWLVLMLAGCGIGSWVNIQNGRIVSSSGRVVILSYEPAVYLLESDLLEQSEGPVRRVRFRSYHRLEDLKQIWSRQLEEAGWREVCREFVGVPLFGGPYLRLRYNRGPQDLSLLAQPEGGGVTRVELRRPPALGGSFWGCPLD